MNQDMASRYRFRQYSHRFRTYYGMPSLYTPRLMFWFSSLSLDSRSLNLGNYRVYSIYISGELSFEVSVTKKRIEN
ncbi:hypothetical protein DTO280E4_4879 [Paecilomyces variotii]|nr:hypothetical protein DTO280E4_4879 [Paecilomyces variotii]